MTENLTFTTQWWAWWSNPVIGMHADHRLPLDFKVSKQESMDYFHLLELRSTLELSDLPDERILSRPELCALAIVSDEVFARHLYPFAVFTMDSSILHARPHDWEDNFGVKSPDQIRELVRLRNELPDDLLQIHSKISRHVATSLKNQLFLNDRAKLGFGVYLQSFFPRLFARWKLTQSAELGHLIKHAENFPEDLWDSMDSWCASNVCALYQEVFSEFEIPEFEMDMNDPDFAGLHDDSNMESEFQPSS